MSWFLIYVSRVWWLSGFVKIIRGGTGKFSLCSTGFNILLDGMTMTILFLSGLTDGLTDGLTGADGTAGWVGRKTSKIALIDMSVLFIFIVIYFFTQISPLLFLLLSIYR